MPNSQVATDLTAELAVAQVRTAVLRHLGALFREQSGSDYGIDAQVELVLDQQASGQLLAVQVKGGASAFRTPVEGGWTFPVNARHAKYWLNHSLPVVIVLADLDTKESYWQVVTSDTLQPTKKNFKVFVPAMNTVSSAGQQWDDLARSRVVDIETLYAANLLRIPPSAASYLAKLHISNPRPAESLAADLAAARSDPSGGIRELVNSRADWLDRTGANAWLAVAVFARDHGLERDAAHAYLRLANLDPERRAVRLADAAVSLLGIDDQQAQRLTSEAVRLAPQDSAVLVARALLGGETEELVESLSGRTDAAAQTYLANAALSRGDDSEAIRLFSGLLDNPYVHGAVRLVLARLLSARALTADAEPGDLHAAHDHALAALTDRRRWTEQTADALTAYGRALAVQLRFRELLQATAPWPHGTATRTEAGNVEVALLALGAAQDQDRPDLYHVIIAAVLDDEDRTYIADVAGVALGVSRAERITHERSVLARAVKRDDKQRAFQAAMELALMGADESAQLMAVGLGDGYVEQVRVIARAVEDPEANLPRLRALAGTEIAAAEVVVRLLLESGNPDAAADACELYYSVYTLPSFLLKKITALLLQEDDDGAAHTYERLLASGKLRSEPYLQAHNFLAEWHGIRREWVPARDHFVVVLAESPVLPPVAYWNLVQCYIELGELNAARRLLNDRYLEPANEREVRAWAQVVSETGWTDATASLAVTIARREDTSPQLAAALVGNVVVHTRGVGASDEESEASDQRPTVSGDVHRAAFQVMSQLAEAGGGEFPFRTLSGDTESLVNEMRAMLAERDTTPVRTLLRQVSMGDLPVGMLCEVRNDPYSLILAGRGRQPRVASHSEAFPHALETQAARAARNGRVVVDLSAIELAQHLDRWEGCFGQFNVAMVTTMQRADAQRGLMAARSATAEGGTVGLDANGELYVTENDTEVQLITLQRCEAIEKATRRCVAIDVGNDVTLHPELPPLGMSSWLSAVELAGREGVPLWSDDVAQRKIAAFLGIPTFGTVNLVEGLREARFERATAPEEVDRLLAEQHHFVLDLMRSRVVDQPVTLMDVLADIPAYPGELSAAATAVSRASWWRQTQTPIEDWDRILAEVRKYAPEHIRSWQAAAMTGLANAVPVEFAPRIVGTFAALGVGTEPSVEDAVAGFRLADSVLAQQVLSPASAHVAWAVASLGDRIAGIDPDAFAQEVVAGLS